MLLVDFLFIYHRFVGRNVEHVGLSNRILRMSKQKKQRYSGIVYSTDTDFEYDEVDGLEAVDTLPNSQQKLTVMLDRKARKGKAVTLVTGFVGSKDDLEALGKRLKQKCAVGGAVKDGEVIIQGDFRQRVVQLLAEEGYKVKISGG